MAKREQHEEQKQGETETQAEQEAKKIRNVTPRTPISRELHAEIMATKKHLEGRFKPETVDDVVKAAVDVALKGKTLELMRAHARAVSDF